MRIESAHKDKWAWVVIKNGMIEQIGIESFCESDKIWCLKDSTSNGGKEACLKTMFIVGGKDFYNKIVIAAKKDNIPQQNYFKAVIKKKEIENAEESVREAKKALKMAWARLAKVKHN